MDDSLSPDLPPENHNGTFGKCWRPSSAVPAARKTFGGLKAETLLSRSPEHQARLEALIEKHKGYSRAVTHHPT